MVFFRFTFTEGVLYNQFLSQGDFETVRNFAESENVRIILAGFLVLNLNQLCCSTVILGCCVVKLAAEDSRCDKGGTRFRQEVLEEAFQRAVNLNYET